MDRGDAAEALGIALEAGRFLAAALDLAEDGAHLAGDFVQLDGDRAAVTFAIELDSSAGPAAFLVYAYRLREMDDAGRTGEERFHGDLATMTEAERLGAPGPRLVGHAADGVFGFVLATSPAFRRALTGEPDVPDPAPALDAGDRGELAARLMGSLLDASAAAARWLAVVEATEWQGERPEAETELALRLLEPGMLAPLMEAIQRLAHVSGRFPRDQTGHASPPLA